MAKAARPLAGIVRGLFAAALLAALAPTPLPAEEPGIDLSRAVVVDAGGGGKVARKGVRLLVEEVGKRSHVHWPAVDGWPDGTGPVIVVGRAEAVRALAAARGLPAALGQTDAGPEGYRIGVEAGQAAPVVWVAGHDDRGVLYGAGRLLRALRVERTRVELPRGFAVESTPRTRIRGMQLGYRPKTNAYDGWTVTMWEQYLRDLVVFGCNAVELIPPRSDDDDDSPHFPLPKLTMMTEMSRLADDYGLDVWIWYPALDRDYADRGAVERALKEWAEVFGALPRVDAVFVPGGDPGHTEPKVLLALLEAQTANLQRIHPRAGMWVSPQSFTQAWLDQFLDLLRKEPTWLAGVVHGPQVRIDLPALRAAVPARYPIRDYPDITHSRHCQYPVPDWDVVFALAEGRETINPRPQAMAAIARRSRPSTAGFIGYSEGCNDDVNKMVWLAVGWDERTPVDAIVRDYARYFIGARLADEFAEGLLGLERNWQGAALDNASIATTLARFQALEHASPPAVRQNWRFQMALYRAYYDALLQSRLREESRRLREARGVLETSTDRNAASAIAAAETILVEPPSQIGAPLRARLFELAEALFQSIHMQLSVARYQAIALERGANLDAVDVPLTDAAWLRGELAAIRRLDNDGDRRTRLRALMDRTDPGPGGFYDDLGDPTRQPHLVRGAGVAEDPAFYASSLVGFGFRGLGSARPRPRAWWTHAEALYDAPLLVRYEGLDRGSPYRVRVVYSQERSAGKIRLDADERFPIHGDLARPFEPLEFPIPAEATADGSLTLRWSQPPGGGGTGRGCQVAEVWLLKGPETR